MIGSSSKDFDCPCGRLTWCLLFQFRAGLKLIQQAYEDRHQALVDEVNHWKWISEDQNVQVGSSYLEVLLSLHWM
jgi:hypothetical protein